MYIVSYSSLLPVGEIKPNKCNPGIKPNNPDSVQEDNELRVCYIPSI